MVLILSQELKGDRQRTSRAPSISHGRLSLMGQSSDRPFPPIRSTPGWVQTYNRCKLLLEARFQANAEHRVRLSLTERFIPLLYKHIRYVLEMKDGFSPADRWGEDAATATPSSLTVVRRRGRLSLYYFELNIMIDDLETSPTTDNCIVRLCSVNSPY